LRIEALTEEFDLDVRAQSHVVRKIPTNMVWGVINHDLVTIPKPISAIAQVVGSDAEKEAAKPESSWTAALKMEDVTGTKPASEMAVLPGMVEVIVRVTTASLMSIHSPSL